MRVGLLCVWCAGSQYSSMMWCVNRVLHCSVRPTVQYAYDTHLDIAAQHSPWIVLLTQVHLCTSLMHHILYINVVVKPVCVLEYLYVYVFRWRWAPSFIGQACFDVVFSYTHILRTPFHPCKPHPCGIHTHSLHLLHPPPPHPVTTLLHVQKLGARGHTSFANLLTAATLLWMGWKPSRMHIWGALLLFPFAMERRSAVGAQCVTLAGSVGMGKGEYSGAFANLRALVVAATPLLYARVYAWGSSRGGNAVGGGGGGAGRRWPGAPYAVAAGLALVAEVLHRSLDDDEIDGVHKGEEGGCR